MPSSSRDQVSLPLPLEKPHSCIKILTWEHRTHQYLSIPCLSRVCENLSLAGQVPCSSLSHQSSGTELLPIPSLLCPSTQPFTHYILLSRLPGRVLSPHGPTHSNNAQEAPGVLRMSTCSSPPARTEEDYEQNHGGADWISLLAASQGHGFNPL